MVVDTINDKNDPSREMVKKDGTNVEKRNEENCTEPEGGITEQTVRRSQGESRMPKLIFNLSW